jgi:uncharacterized BrkB/YihY/UPF0761 family membrane protein
MVLSFIFVIFAYFRKQFSRKCEKYFNEIFRENTKANIFGAEILASYLTVIT